MKNLLGLSQNELATELIRYPDPKVREGDQDRLAKRAKVRAKQIYAWVYQRGVRTFDEMTDLSQELRAWLAAEFSLLVLEPRVPPTESEDGTTKFLWALPDGKTVESVLIPANGRLTGCISSQVGCAMACKFCLTGIQGLDRSLSAAEIVAQVVALRRVAPVTNIVFMGMGEPLHNVDNVISACRVLIDQEGLGFSKRKVTVSTSGLVPAIERLGKEIDVSLAISLNATTDEVRDEIMPVNKKWNLETLLETCRKYPLGAHRYITFEYVLLAGVNDFPEDARRLVGLMHGIPAKVNLIPFNEHPGSDFKRPPDDVVRDFHQFLLRRGVTTTVRISRGRDILAACGQLRSSRGTARGTDRHRDSNYGTAELNA